MLQASSSQDQEDSEQAEGPAVLAEVHCPPGSRLDFSWGLGSKLHVCAVQGPWNQQHWQQIEDGAVATVEWGVPSAAERRVAYDTLPKYKQLHIQQQAGAAAQQNENVEPWRAVLEYSRTVSDILAAGDTGDNAATSDTPEAEVVRERALWELLASFFVDTGRTQGIITEDLVGWLQRNEGALSARPLSPVLASIRGAALPEEQAGYWGAAARAVAVGRAEEAGEVLGLHTAWARWHHDPQRRLVQPQIDVLEPAVLLLRKMPRFRREGSVDVTGRAFDDLPEYLHYRRGWQEQCCALLAAREHWEECEEVAPATAAGVRQLLGAMAGLEAALLPASDNWVELLVAELLHCYPNLQAKAELGALMERCIQLKGADAQLLPPLTALPDLLQAAAEADVQEVMAVASHVCSPWFMAHIPDILAAHPRGPPLLSRPLPPHLGGDQAEFYTLEYATHLMGHPTTWQVAAEYLAWCPVHGEATLRLLLQRLPLTAGDGRKALQALRIARAHGLQDCAASVARRMGSAHWQQGRCGEALWWALAAGDEAQAAMVLRPVLASVQAAYTIPSTSGSVPKELDHLEGVLNSAAPGEADAGVGVAGAPGPLGFLRAYLRLQRALETVRTTPATCAPQPQQLASAQAVARGAVLALVASRTAPASLWLPILFQSIPLLEAAPPPFSVADVQSLLARLQEIAMDEVYDETFVIEDAGEPQPGAVHAAQMQAVRLALSRNLARAHVNEF